MPPLCRRCESCTPLSEEDRMVSDRQTGECPNPAAGQRGHPGGDFSHQRCEGQQGVQEAAAAPALPGSLPETLSGQAEP